jgi:molybdate transport system ATP-binding protein
MTAAETRSASLKRIELQRCNVRLGRHWALRDVSLAIGRGERWLLLGANGAGKTVLLKVLHGDLWPTPRPGHVPRRYLYADGSVEERTSFASDRIAYLGPERQDRYDRYESTLTVAQVVLTGFDDSDFPLQLPTAAQKRRIAEVLRNVALKGVAERRFVTLSYGQRRRALLARAIVRRPDVLLLDEALNGLDATGRQVFLRALRRSVPPRTTWVLSSHRRTDVEDSGVTHLARIVRGRVQQTGPIATGLATVPRQRLAARDSRRPRAAAGPQSRTGAARSATARALQSSNRRDTVLLRIERAAVYRDESLVIAAFDWTLARGEHWRLSGLNGAGKSTLMAMLYGDLWPRHGGKLERRWPAVEDWKRRVGLVSPELQATYAATGCTVEEIVASGLQDSVGLNVRPSPAERRRVWQEIRAWGLAELAQRHARELSYGQLRLVLAARAFVRVRRLYLLDEPFDGLDPETRARFHGRLDAAVRRGGATVVIASHHDEDVPPYVRHELKLRRGRAPLAGALNVRAESMPRRR